MDAPSLITHKERYAIAKEIASKYYSFASVVSITFSKRMIHIVISADKEFKVPAGSYTIVMELEDF